MINYIWLFMFLSGVVAAFLQGKPDLVTLSLLNGSKEALTVCFGFLSVMTFWLGILNIAKEAGLLAKISSFLRPFVSFLFPELPLNSPAIGYILANISANLLGLGSVATPMGIKAMEELQKINKYKEIASPYMCTLLVINTAGFTLVPTTIIAIRLKHGSYDPTDIITTTLIATLFSTSIAIIFDKIYRFKFQKQRKM